MSKSFHEQLAAEINDPPKSEKEAVKRIQSELDEPVEGPDLTAAQEAQRRQREKAEDPPRGHGVVNTTETLARGGKRR